MELPEEKAMSAPIPENETQRLEELDSYQILDTMSEQAFDDITALASYICQTPIALMSLVDRDRQWFKSAVGYDVPETHRDLAFCAHAVWDPSEMLVVEDAASDPRFSSNPLVRNDPQIRFYAGAPLLTSSGNALGTLCVIDRVPRELTQGQLDSLEALSRLVMAQMEMRKTLLRLDPDQAEEEAA